MNSQTIAAPSERVATPDHVQVAGSSSPGNRGKHAAPTGANDHTRRMLEAPPFPLLVKMASPNAIAFLVQASVSIAEAWFIARLGTAPLAAIALMFPALMLMQMLANGAMGGAVASAVARALGRGDRAGAEALVWHALVIALGAALLFTVLYFVFGPALLARTGAPAEVTAEAARYGSILFAGTIPIWIVAFLSSIVRGSGNMKLPAALMIGGSMVQVPLSGALILGWFGLPALGLRGAAVAIVAISVMNTLILVARLVRPDAVVRLVTSACVFRTTHFGAIFRVGLLAALSPIFVVLTISALNVLIGGFGVAALAGYGIVARLEFLLVPMVFGIGAALTALVGVNVGAGNLPRAERIGWLGGFAAAGITGVVGLLLALAPGLWLDLFADDPASWQAGAAYLHIVGPVFLFQGLGLSLYFASQGAGTVTWPVVATVLRFVVCVGGAALAVHVLDLGLGAVYACIALGMALYGIVTAGSIALGAWRPRGVT
jgi:putative MATE family efflux protein